MRAADEDIRAYTLAKKEFDNMADKVAVLTRENARCGEIALGGQHARDRLKEIQVENAVLRRNLDRESLKAEDLGDKRNRCVLTLPLSPPICLFLFIQLIH